MWAEMRVYTLFEDSPHGADMVGSLLVDFLVDAVETLGFLPRLGHRSSSVMSIILGRHQTPLTGVAYFRQPQTSIVLPQFSQYQAFRARSLQIFFTRADTLPPVVA